MLDLFGGMTTRRSYSRKKQAAGGSGPGPGSGSGSSATPHDRSRRYKNHRISEVEVGSSPSWRRRNFYGQQPSPTIPDGGGCQSGTVVSHGHFQEHRSVNPSSPSVCSSQGEGARSPLSPTAGFSSNGGSGKREDPQTARLLERCETCVLPGYEE